MSSAVEVLVGNQLEDLLAATHRDVADLGQQGYTLLGGIRYTTHGMTGRTVVMVGRARDRLAAVLAPYGTAISITSASSDDRRVVSRNGAFWELLPWELRNDLSGVGPRRLDEAHSDALAHVREHFTPRIRAADESIHELAEAIDADLRLREGVRLVVSGSVGPLGDDPRSARRIERWRSAEPPRSG